MTSKATTLVERYEALRMDILHPTSAKKVNYLDLELMLSGGVIALISNVFPLDARENSAKMEAADGFAGIPRIIGQMARASVMTEQYGV